MLFFLKDNYRHQLIAIPKEISEKYKALEQAYDNETDHSKNRLQQWKWNQRLKEELVRLKTENVSTGSQ